MLRPPSSPPRCCSLSGGAQTFRAGTATADITLTEFPVIVNGGFLEKQATKANDALHARALVLDDGKTRLALCVVDTCMMTREFIDAAKETAHRHCGIAVDRMRVSAETANSVTLKLPDATTRTVLRTEIAALQSQHTSLMPDGLEAAIPQQDMADLIAFLKGAAHGR